VRAAAHATAARHGGPVTALAAAFDGAFVFSGAADGSLFCHVRRAAQHARPPAARRDIWLSAAANGAAAAALAGAGARPAASAALRGDAAAG